MNLKILFLLLMYYTIIIITFGIGGSIFTDDAGYNVTGELNGSAISEDETDTGGIFGTGVSFGRFLALTFFGIGLPASTPAWFVFIFASWQTIVTIFSIGFIISSIWDG